MIIIIKGAHTRVPYTISATLLSSEILAANISRYAVYAISKDRDNSNDGVRYLENAITTVWLHSNQSSPSDGKPIQVGSKLAVAVQLANYVCSTVLCQHALVNLVIDFLSGHRTHACAPLIKGRIQSNKLPGRPASRQLKFDLELMFISLMLGLP